MFIYGTHEASESPGFVQQSMPHAKYCSLVPRGVSSTAENYSTHITFTEETCAARL
jgi:hypothetical protein